MSNKNQKPEKTRDEPHNQAVKDDDNLVNLNDTETKSAAELTSENQALQKTIADLEKTLANLKDNQKKLMLATKVNTLKEQEIQNEDFKRYVNQRLIETRIIPVLQNFEQALKFEINMNNVDSFLVGFQYIFSNLKDNLAKEGLEIVNVKKGMPFDSRICEVVKTEEVNHLPDGVADNTVIEVLANGYQLHKRIVCPAKVNIIKLKQTTTEKNEQVTEKE